MNTLEMYKRLSNEDKGNLTIYCIYDSIYSVARNEQKELDDEIIKDIQELSYDLYLEDEYYNLSQAKIADFITRGYVENNNKIDNNNRKSDKLIELFLNEYISQSEYSKKKKELDDSTNNLIEKNNQLESEKGYTKNDLISKIEKLKNSLLKQLDFDNLSDELIDSVIKNIIVKNDHYEWQLNFINDIINIEIAGKKNSAELNLYKKKHFCLPNKAVAQAVVKEK